MFKSGICEIHNVFDFYALQSWSMENDFFVCEFSDFQDGVGLLSRHVYSMTWFSGWLHI
jgi:hypothetical protein